MFNIISHRANIKNIIKENSLLGINSCIKNGIEMIEIDIRLSKDEKIVIFHDEDLNRIYNVNMKIKDYDSDCLKEYFNIPTLDYVFKIIKNDCKIYLDIKGKEKKIIKILKGVIENNIHNISFENIYIASFNLEFTDLIFKNLKMKIKKGIIIENKDYLFNSISRNNNFFLSKIIDNLDFISIDIDFLYLLYFLNFDFKKIKIFVWTVNTKKIIGEIEKLCKIHKISNLYLVTDKPLFIKNMLK